MHHLPESQRREGFGDVGDEFTVAVTALILFYLQPYALEGVCQV